MPELKEQIELPLDIPPENREKIGDSIFEASDEEVLKFDQIIKQMEDQKFWESL